MYLLVEARNLGMPQRLRGQFHALLDNSDAEGR
jgi:hypothetical protein